MAETRATNPLVAQFRRGGVARDLRLMAAQGLLLDYPGCAKHWRTKEVPTDTSLAQLERLMAQTEAA